MCYKRILSVFQAENWIFIAIVVFYRPKFPTNRKTSPKNLLKEWLPQIYTSLFCTPVSYLVMPVSSYVIIFHCLNSGDSIRVGTAHLRVKSWNRVCWIVCVISCQIIGSVKQGLMKGGMMNFEMIFCLSKNIFLCMTVFYEIDIKI